MTNFTSAHESRASLIGADRFNYPDGHIESDNRLCWQLGRLDQVFGDSAKYVHLKRNKAKVAKSYAKRFESPASIMRAYSLGIVPNSIKRYDREELSSDYIDVIEANIAFFLRDKTKVMTIDIDDIENAFPVFWKWVEAEGDFEGALKACRVKHNPNPRRSLLSRRGLSGLYHNLKNAVLIR